MMAEYYCPRGRRARLVGSLHRLHAVVVRQAFEPTVGRCEVGSRLAGQSAECGRDWTSSNLARPLLKSCLSNSSRGLPWLRKSRTMGLMSRSTTAGAGPQGFVDDHASLGNFPLRGRGGYAPPRP